MYLDDPEIWLTETVAEPSPELMCVLAAGLELIAAELD